MLMRDTLNHLVDLITRGQVRVSDHEYDQLAADHIFVRDLVDGIPDAKLVEDYPDYTKGPCVLVLQTGRDGNAIHFVWGIPKGESAPAVLVTAYRPDREKWTDDFMRRKK